MAPMNFTNRLNRRLRILFRRDDVESDLSDEISLHLEMESQELMRQGHSERSARREARLRLGGVEQTKEAVRDARPLRRLDGIGLDFKLGFRMLRKSWGLTLIGGLAMAIAICIGTTAFAFIDAYEGGTLPLAEGDRVVRLMAAGQRGAFTSAQDFEWWREGMQSVEDLGAFQTIERLLVTRDGSNGRVSVAQMTSSGFRVARIPPLLGRPLLEEDERAGAPPVVVIGYGVWQARFAGDRAALGQTIQLGGVDHVIVGIMPENFKFPINHQVWTPFRANSTSDARRDVVVFGRLRPGVTIENAEAEITVTGRAPGESAKEEMRTRVVPYAESLAHVPTWWSFVPLAVTLLLIPPCANIAILIYARNVSRQEEFAARYVLGAGRGRIIGQLLIEAFVLAGAAAGVGLLLAHRLLSEILRAEAQDPSIPFWVRPTISLDTVLFLGGLAVFAAVVAGGVPALRATGRMRQSGFQGLGSRTSPRLGLTWTALVVLQVALSTAMLPRFSEGVWMFFNPYIVGREFAVEEYVTARIVLEDEPPGADVSQFGARSRNLQRDVVRQVQDRTGVAEATLSTSIDGIDEKIARIEMDIPGQKPFLTGSNQVDKAYFDVFRASLLAGRAFEAADFTAVHPVVIVDRSFAEHLGGQNLLGKRFRYLSAGKGDSEAGRWYEIVGLVDRISPSAQRPFVYHPYLPGQSDRIVLTLRTGATVHSDLARRLAESTTAMDRNFQVEQFRALKDVYQAERNEENFLGSACASVLVVVLLFSAAGIHTLVVFALVLRRREVGIRSALGAPPLRLVADVFRRDLSPVVAGAFVGSLLAFPVDKLIPRSDGESVSILFVSGVFLLMLMIGLLAVAGPARRALRIDSVEALREG
jgi:predicted permease